MIKFITYLSGNRNWIHPHSTMPQLALGVEEAEFLRELLGAKSLQNCIFLYRLFASFPFLSGLLPKEDVELDFAAIQQTAVASEAALIAIGPGVAASLPITQKVVIPTAVTLKCLNSSQAELSYGQTSLIVHAGYADGVVNVAWPEGWDIRGALKLPKDAAWVYGTTVTVPTRFRYPVQLVDKKLCSDATVYDILMTQGLVETFYSASSAEERLCVVVLALLNLAKV